MLASGNPPSRLHTAISFLSSTHSKSEMHWISMTVANSRYEYLSSSQFLQARNSRLLSRIVLYLRLRSPIQSSCIAVGHVTWIRRLRHNQLRLQLTSLGTQDHLDYTRIQASLPGSACKSVRRYSLTLEMRKAIPPLPLSNSPLKLAIFSST